MKTFCNACQAIPKYGYCNMAGCPMSRDGSAVDCGCGLEGNCPDPPQTAALEVGSPVAWRWPLTDVHGKATDSFGVTTNEHLASLVGKTRVQPLFTRRIDGDLLAACKALKAAFGDPMTRRALGGHNETQQAAIIHASAAIRNATGVGE